MKKEVISYEIFSLVKEQKKLSTTLNYINQSLILNSEVTSCVSVSTFASLIDVSLTVLSSAVG